MVCYCLDLRRDTKLSKFLGNKLVSVIAGILQLVVWIIELFNLIFPSGQLKEMLQQQNSTTFTATAIVLILINMAFSVLLLFGLFKGYPGFMKVYLAANGVMTTLFIVSFFLNLFVQPQMLGVSGFISVIFMILLNVLFFFMIRNYYLAFISSKQPNRGGNV